MTYFRLFGLAFTMLHTISVLFVTKISLARRLALAVWMLLFIVSVPIFYQYLPLVAFLAVCVLSVGVYVALLFSQDIVNMREKKKLARIRSIRERQRETRDFEGLRFRTGRLRDRNMYEGIEPRVEVPPVYQATASHRHSSVISTVTEEQPQVGRTQTENERSQLDSTQEQKVESSVSDNETTRVGGSQSSTNDQHDFCVQLDQQTGVAPEGSVIDKHALNQDLTIETKGLNKNMSVKYDELDQLDQKKTELRSLADEEELLQEIQEILDVHVDGDTEIGDQGVVSEMVSSEEKDEFSLTPITKQTVDVIREKQSEDGLVSVEEQVGRELYFQFLMFECRELLSLEMYQEAVDYLKEILIDSYDKELRRKALDLLESVRVELYYPLLTDSKDEIIKD